MPAILLPNTNKDLNAQKCSVKDVHKYYTENTISSQDQENLGDDFPQTRLKIPPCKTGSASS